jgi:hypothetical protein
MKHSHKCGLTASGEIPWGCGAIFSHEDRLPAFGEIPFLKAHLCPFCGKGPWYFKLKGIALKGDSK